MCYLHCIKLIAFSTAINCIRLISNGRRSQCVLLCVSDSSVLGDHWDRRGDIVRLSEIHSSAGRIICYIIAVVVTAIVFLVKFLRGSYVFMC